MSDRRRLASIPPGQQWQSLSIRVATLKSIISEYMYDYTRCHLNRSMIQSDNICYEQYIAVYDQVPKAHIPQETMFALGS